MTGDDLEARRLLRSVSTATVTTVLFKMGLRRTWLANVRPIRAGQMRIAGPAFTMRFVPAREDLATPAAWASPTSTRAAVEEMPDGCVVVVDALGRTGAGVFGDILCARMANRKVAGLVTDGAVRDGAGIGETGLPAWSAGLAAPPAVCELIFVGWQHPIACGGVAVMPHDTIVADGDGAVVIPAAMLREVALQAYALEEEEEWILGRIREGSSLQGLYPMNAETRARYEHQRAADAGGTPETHATRTGRREP